MRPIILLWIATFWFSKALVYADTSHTLSSGYSGDYSTSNLKDPIKIKPILSNDPIKLKKTSPQENITIKTIEKNKPIDMNPNKDFNEKSGNRRKLIEFEEKDVYQKIKKNSFDDNKIKKITNESAPKPEATSIEAIQLKKIKIKEFGAPSETERMGSRLR